MTWPGVPWRLAFTRARVARAFVLALFLGSQGASAATPESPVERTVRIPEEIPVRRSGDVGESAPRSLRGVVIGLTFLIAMAVVTARLNKGGVGKATRGAAKAWFGSLTRGAKADGVRVVQSVRLTPRSSLHVVRWDGRELLVGCGDAGISVLGSRVPPSDSDAPAAISATAPGAKGGGA